MVDIKGLLFATPEKRVQNIYDYLAQRKFDRARQLIANGLKSDPNYPPYHIALIELEALEGKAQDMRFAVEKFFKIKPDGISDLIKRFDILKNEVSNLYEIYDAIAGCEIKRKEFHSAYEYLKRLSAADAERLSARYKAQCEKLLKGSKEALASNTIYFYKVAFLAECLLKVKDASDAYAALTEIAPADGEATARHISALISTVPKLRQMRLLIGDIWHKAGDISRAAQEYQALLKTDPAYAPQVLERAREFSAQKPSEPLFKILLYQAHIAGRNIFEALDALSAYAMCGKAEQAETIKILLGLREQWNAEPKINLLLARLYLENGDSARGVRAIMQAKEQGSKPTELVPILKFAVEKDPQNGSAHELLGNAYFETGDYALSAEHFRKAVFIEGKHFSILGRAVTILEADISNPEALMLMAEIAKRETHYGRTGVALRYLIRVAPERAKEALQIASPPGNHPQAYLAAIETALEAGETHRALQFFDGFITTYPESAPRALRSAVEIAEKEPQTANRVLEILARIKEKTPAVLFAEGETARIGGIVSKAFESYKSVLSQTPDKALVIQEAMEKMLAEYPQNSALRLDLVELYFSLRLYDKIRPQLERLTEEAPQEMPRIVEKYKALRSRVPGDIELSVGLMKAYIKARMPKAAIKLAAEAMPLAKDKAEHLAEINFYLGDAFRDASDLARAVACYGAASEKSRDFISASRKRIEEITAASPSATDAFLWLGRLYALEGRWDEGLKAYGALLSSDKEKAPQILEEISARCGGYHPARMLEARIYFLQGNAEEAASALLKIPPDSPDLLKDAVGEINSVLAREPKNALLRFARGDLKLKLGGLREGASDLFNAYAIDKNIAERALKRSREMQLKFPAEGVFYLLNAKILLSEGDPKSALDELQKLPSAKNLADEDKNFLGKCIDDASALTEHDGALLSALSHEAFRLGFADRGLVLSGRSVILDGVNTDLVISDLDTLMKEEKYQNSAVYLTRASALAQKKRFGEAIADIMRAIETEPKTREDALPLVADIGKQSGLFDAVALEADMLMALGQWKNARRVLSQTAIKDLSPDKEARIHIRIGMVAEQLGDAESASEAFEKAYQLVGNDDEILAAVHDFGAAIVQDRIKAMKDDGKFEKFSPAEREMLSRYATPALLSRLEGGKKEDIVYIKGLCYLWAGNSENALRLYSDSDDRFAVHLAERTGKPLEALARLELMAKKHETPFAQSKLSALYEIASSEALADAPKAITAFSKPIEYNKK